MKRVTLYLSDTQHAKIEEQSQVTGLKMSEVVRRLLDQALALAGTQDKTRDLHRYIAYLYDKDIRGN